MSSGEYVFREVGEGTFERVQYGMEGLTDYMSEYAEGFSHLTTTVAVTIASAPARKDLEPLVRDAWIRFRHAVPGIACRSSRRTAPDSRFVLRYAVPRSVSDAEMWAKETVIFTDDVKSLYEKHCELRNGRWWLSSVGHYVAELHVSPLEHGWHFSIVISHNSADGRNLFAIFELFLDFLASTLEKTAKPVADLRWGEEVRRLLPPGPFIHALATTGSPPEFPINPTTSTAVPKDEANGAPLQKVLWQLPTFRTGGKGDISRIVKFSPEVTSRLHATAKKRGRTVTQILTAIHTLAHAETALRTAGEDHYKEIAEAFVKSTHMAIPLNFANHRHKFPGGYNSYKTAEGAPTIAHDAAPITLTMDAIRKAITVDGEKRTVVRNADEVVFWDGVVKDVANGWAAIDTSLDGYLIRDSGLEAGNASIGPGAYDNSRALCISSIGDLGRLGILTSYLPSPPSASTEQTKTLTVDDVLCNMRVRTPFDFLLMFQYNGRLSSLFTTGGEFATTVALKLETDIFEEWIAAILHLPPQSTSIGDGDF